MSPPKHKFRESKICSHDNMVNMDYMVNYIPRFCVKAAMSCRIFVARKNVRSFVIKFDINYDKIFVLLVCT